MTIIKQRKIIADKHIYESPEDFKEFQKGKKKKTQQRYSQYRRRSRDLLERGFSQKYDKKTNTFIYSKKGISKDELKKKPRQLKTDTHYVHGILFLCKVSAVEFEHVYHYASKKEYIESIALAKHRNVFQNHEVIHKEFLGSKVVSD